MFLGIPQVNKFIETVKISQVDDFIDRCNYYYTVLLLVFFSLLVGSKQYFGEPIKCLVEQQYTGSWMSYVHDYCFIMERYKLTAPKSSGLSEFYPDKKDYYVSYYQWIPFLLLVQAISFHTPHFLWRSLQKLFSLDTEMTVEEAVKIRTLFGEDRQKAINNLAKYIEEFLSFPSTKSGGFSLFPLKNVVLCSTWLYIGSKLLNSLNIIIQLMVINTYIGDGNFFWGLNLLGQLVRGDDWTKTGQFPRVVYCDYEMIEMANVAQKNVQCTLTINILNEKIYLILTLWLLVLFVCTASNALLAIAATLLPSLRERETRFYLTPSLPLEEDDDSLGAIYYSGHDGRFRNLSENSTVTASVGAQMNQNNFIMERDRIRDLLPDRGSDSEQEEFSSKNDFEQTLRYFTCSVLGIDGVQLIRFMRLHAGTLIARDVAFTLWKDFLNAKKSQSQFLRRSINWQPLLHNATALKETSSKADNGCATQPNACNTYGDRVERRPTAPCQTDSSGNSAGSSECNAGSTPC